MKMRKKIIPFILAVLIATSFSTDIAFAAQAPSSWAVKQVEEAKGLGLATSALLDDFSATTTRLEFCGAAVNLLRVYGYDVDSITPKTFSDTSDRDIGIAAALGIVSPINPEKNSFSPNRPITREQAQTLFSNVFALIYKRVANEADSVDAANIINKALQFSSALSNRGIGGADSSSPEFLSKTPFTHEQTIVALLRVWKHLNPVNNTYTPPNYNPGNLRESKNQVSLRNDVKSVSAPQGVNKLTSIDESKRQYVFDNIDDSIRKLSVGDKFVIYPCASVPKGVSIIVSAISISGKRAIITSKEVSFGDIVKSMDVAQSVPMTKDMVLEYGDGVTPVSSASYAAIQTSASIQSKPEIAQMSAHASLAVEPLVLAVNIPIDNSAKIVGNITISPTLKADIDLHEGWFNIPTDIDYFEISIDNQMKSTLRLEALYNNQVLDMASIYRIQDNTLKQKYQNYKKMTKVQCDNYRAKLFASEFPIPTAPGLSATVTWYLKMTINGRISVEAVYTQNNEFGIKLQGKQWSPISTNYTNIALKGAADASVYLGAGIDIGLSYIGMLAASIAPEAGLEVTASTSFDESIIGSASAGKPPHDCAMCIDGDINGKISLWANVDAIGIGNVLSKELIRSTKKLGDFYYTLGGTSHGAEFGWSECPYMKSSEQPANIPSDAIIFNGHAYKVFDIGMTWHEAKAYCENLGGHLVTITTQDEQDFIKNLIDGRSKQHYWIGGTDSYSEGRWEWVTNEPWVFSAWADGEPNEAAGGEDYLEIYFWGWNDLKDIGGGHTNMFTNGGFICEWD